MMIAQSVADPQRSREAFGRGDRPDVLQYLCAQAAARARNCMVFPRALRTAGAVCGRDEPYERNFVAKLESCAAQYKLPLVQFRKGERKNDVMAEHLRKFADRKACSLSARRSNSARR